MMADNPAASPSEFVADLKRAAAAEGFDICRITHPDAIPEAGGRLREFLDSGYHGDMDWMETHAARRAHPAQLWSQVKSVIVLGMNYGPDENPLPDLLQSDKGVISVYARRRDYHDVIKKKLKALARWMVAQTAADVKVFVDTAPVMEKPLAEAAGLGWQGKHTNLVSRDFGSWLFLGSVFTTADLPIDPPEPDHCGACQACLDICPTNAFPAPYKLDARRCISYLTIEHKGTIPVELRAQMGNHIYGCDDCLAVCPWNKFAQTAREAKLAARDDLTLPDLEMLVQLDDAAFRAYFTGSPIKRTGRDRFVRNVLIAIGNMDQLNDTMRSHVETRLADAAPAVRAMAVWALGRHDPTRARQLAKDWLAHEQDPAVRDEWQAVGT
ncbi:MAG: tRNA epoxyqueuosine(34) reductase QueG [PS1 clade bacterium]|nr:tRNA epoxyqueuosine(34) reductase QueG [Rhodobiaceae bacterium]MBL6786561.1 tRNA epoxyqueuosine(34) reductase QueG [PS1 clade bacterium]